MHYLLQNLHLRFWILSRQSNYMYNIFDKKECLFRTMNFTAPGSRLLVFRCNDYTGQGYNFERLFFVLQIYSIMSLNFVLQFLNNIIRI